MHSDNYYLKWNKTKTDLVLVDSENNDIVKLKNIEAFFTKIGVAGLGRGNIKRIMDAGFDSIEKIITMSIEDFKTVEGFKDKMSTKVYNSIRESLKTVKLAKLMNASKISDIANMNFTAQQQVALENSKIAFLFNSFSGKKLHSGRSEIAFTSNSTFLSTII